MRVCVLTDSPKSDSPLQELATEFDTEFIPTDRLSKSEPSAYLVVDVDLGVPSSLLALKEWIGRKPKDGKAVFTLRPGASRLHEVRAAAIGATDILFAPVQTQAIIHRLLGSREALFKSRPAALPGASQELSQTADCLFDVFHSAWHGGGVDLSSMVGVGDVMADALSAHGLSAWVRTVREHHSQTFQHCLLVMGVAGAFAAHLGFCRQDRERVAHGAILHDLGKARVPVEILEKPGPLEPGEVKIIRRHPEWGCELLNNERLAPELREVVLHHHEYLDGSGYPHGLREAQIPDLVRIMTISDVFSALIERRSYKPASSGEAAYRILLEMGSKLDKALLHEFRHIALAS